MTMRERRITTPAKTETKATVCVATRPIHKSTDGAGARTIRIDRKGSIVGENKLVQLDEGRLREMRESDAQAPRFY